MNALITKLKNIIQHPSNDKIDAELVHLLYVQAQPGIIASFLVATFLLIAFYHVIPFNTLSSWYLLIVLITIFRIRAVQIYFKKSRTDQTHYFWKKIFICIVGSAGIAWPIVGILLPPDDGIYQTFLVCALAGVSGGAVPFFSGSRLACAAFIVPMLLTFSVYLIMQANLQQIILGIFVLIYLAVLTISSFRTHAAIYSAVRLKFENDELVKLLRNSEEQYRLVTDALPVLISYIDNHLNYKFNNKVHEVWFGKPLSEITGVPVSKVLGNIAYTIFAEHYEKVLTKGQVSYETIMQFRDGEERYVTVTLIPHIQDNQVKGVFSLISDMTPRINYLATHDALTDLPNRSLFNARFSQALKRAYRRHYQVALLFLDLDHFKNINDTLGHDVGDHLLIKVVERIQSCLRKLDTLARLGGDEFTIILEDVTTDAVVAISSKICQAFTQPFHVEGHDIFITTSIGISLYPDDGKDMQQLLKNADMAIYRSKDRGRNTFEFYTDELNEKVTKKLTVETALRTALEKNEFLLYYQPLVDINTKRVCALEALIRWNHPETGLVSPSEFIPVAEEVGLIVPIGEWIFQTACLQSLAWQNDKNISKNLRVSINLSARQFREKNLTERFIQVLNETGLSGECLTLELTETLIMHDIDYSIRVINALKNTGMSISIDDFGTGYSSLNYLRRFPIDILKIDRSFITDLAVSQDGASIVSAIIAMGHSLKMKVVAEGVETITQYQFLKEKGCDEIQGYLVSKPLPAEQITVFIRNDYSAEKLLNPNINMWF